MEALQLHSKLPTRTRIRDGVQLSAHVQMCSFVHQQLLCLAKYLVHLVRPLLGGVLKLQAEGGTAAHPQLEFAHICDKGRRRTCLLSRRASLSPTTLLSWSAFRSFCPWCRAARIETREFSARSEAFLTKAVRVCMSGLRIDEDAEVQGIHLSAMKLCGPVVAD